MPLCTNEAPNIIQWAMAKHMSPLQKCPLHGDMDLHSNNGSWGPRDSATRNGSAIFEGLTNVTNTQTDTHTAPLSEAISIQQHICYACNMA